MLEDRKPELDKTWTNFKTHFCHAHQESRETTDITLEESDLQRNNANLVQQVVESLQHAMVAEPPAEEPSDLMLQMAHSVTTVMLPDSTNSQATHSGQLPFHHSFSAKAKTAHVLDGITNASLISIGQLLLSPVDP
jgi:hypothetical protein